MALTKGAGRWTNEDNDEEPQGFPLQFLNEYRNFRSLIANTNTNEHLGLKIRRQIKRENPATNTKRHNLIAKRGMAIWYWALGGNRILRKNCARACVAVLII